MFQKFAAIIVLCLVFSCGTNEDKTTKNDTFNQQWDSLLVTPINGSRLDTEEGKTGDQKKNNIPLLELSLLNGLTDKSIDSVFKKIIMNNNLIKADDKTLLSVVDSLFAKDEEMAFFYFLAFTKSMNGADGHYSEALGYAALSYVENHTESFAYYFNIGPMLTSHDFSNWAGFVHSEITIENPGNEAEKINQLQIVTAVNMKESRKEHCVVLEKFMEKLKSIPISK